MKSSLLLKKKTQKLCLISNLLLKRSKRLRAINVLQVITGMSIFNIVCRRQEDFVESLLFMTTKQEDVFRIRELATVEQGLNTITS